MFFFAYIGFGLTAFAFLCQYLVFPKTLLTDLSNMIYKRPPHIMDQKFAKLTNKSVYNIICFFFELDVITYTLLAYIIYSMFVALICALVHLHLIGPSCGKWIAVIASIVYAIIIWILVITTLLLLPKPEKEKERMLCKLWRSRVPYAIVEFILSVILLSLVFASLLWRRSGMVLFVSLVLFLMVLLAWYLIPLAHRKPVRNLLVLWSKDEDTDSSRQRNEQTVRLSSLRSASIVLVKLDIDHEKKVNLTIATAKHFERYISKGATDHFSYNLEDPED